MIEEKLKDAKGDSGEQSQNIKQEYDNNNEDTKDKINDDLQYLSDASTHNDAGTNSQEETTENNEEHEDMSNQGDRKKMV